MWRTFIYVQGKRGGGRGKESEEKMRGEGWRNPVPFTAGLSGLFHRKWLACERVVQSRWREARQNLVADGSAVM